jgi:hypothetical protein
VLCAINDNSPEAVILYPHVSEAHALHIQLDPDLAAEVRAKSAPV